MSEQENATLTDDNELTRLILWYVKCQNDNGRGATEEEIEAFGRWYEGTQRDRAFIELMLLKDVCVKMDGEEPCFWLSESGMLKTDHIQHERKSKRRESKG